MTRWRAVSLGILFALVVEACIWLVIGRLTLVGGLSGSGMAGYLASQDPPDGAWHGLLSALSWGIVLIPAAVLLALSNGEPVPFPFEFVIPLLESRGELTTALVLAVTLPNVLAGAVGSVARWRSVIAAEAVDGGG